MKSHSTELHIAGPFWNAMSLTHSFVEIPLLPMQTYILLLNYGGHKESLGSCCVTGPSWCQGVQVGDEAEIGLFFSISPHPQI